MDRRLIVPAAGGIGLLYCTWMTIESQLEEGWTAWGIAGAVVMLGAAIAALVIAWNRNKEIKADNEYYAKLREEEKAQRESESTEQP